MAQRDDDLDLDVEASEKKPGAGHWKKIALFSLVGVLLVGLSVTTTLLLMRGGNDRAADSGAASAAQPNKAPAKAQAKTDKKTASTEVAGHTPHYLDLNPPFVVNLDDNSGVRFLQVSVAVMSYNKDNLEKVKENMPVVRNYLMLLFSSQKFADIKTREGKLKLQAEALKVVQKALKEVTGKTLVDAVYLPGIVGQ